MQALVSGLQRWGGALHRHETHDSSGMCPTTFDARAAMGAWSDNSPPLPTSGADTIGKVSIELNIARSISEQVKCIV
jgi:hypothetical protein